VAAITTRDMFDRQRRGRAWCCCPKPRRRGWLRSNRRMPSCDAEPASFPERQEGIVEPGPIALVKRRAEALGIKNAKIAGLLLPGFPY